MSLPASHPWIHGEKYKTIKCFININKSIKQKYKTGIQIKTSIAPKVQVPTASVPSSQAGDPTLLGGDSILTLDTESILKSSRSCICSNQLATPPGSIRGSHNEGQTTVPQSKRNRAHNTSETSFRN